MKIIITGGHLSPALSVIDEITVSHKETEIIFVGRKYVSGKDKSPTLEYKEITKREIKFYHLNAGRLTHVASLSSLINFLKTPVGFIQALNIVKAEKPNLILSFGGYLALPVAFAAFLLKIPVYSHEQTISPGLANKIIDKFANKIFISFEESQHFFSGKKTVLTGNPVKTSVLKIINKPFNIEKNKFVLYVTGGSLGSHSINDHIQKILRELLKKYIVIHQTGNVKNYNDFEKLKNFKARLPPEIKNNYYLVEHFSEDELGYIYSLADLVVSRAGANTFFELIFLKKPTIFIPLPWAANQEQLKQALIFQNAGTSEIFNQSEDSQKLFLLIEKVINNLDKYKNNFNNLINLYHKNAAKNIVQEIF